MSSDAEAVFDKIDSDELIKVALDLANIDSPTGREGPVADYVSEWLRRVESRRELAGLCDRALRDIGITRVDALREADKPFWRP